VPAGTAGLVTQAQRVTRASQTVDVYEVAINLYPPKYDSAQAVVGTKRAPFPHVRKDTYEQFLREVD
jgi:hypothetical protein